VYFRNRVIVFLSLDLRLKLMVMVVGLQCLIVEQACSMFEQAAVVTFVELAVACQNMVVPCVIFPLFEKKFDDFLKNLKILK